MSSNIEFLIIPTLLTKTILGTANDADTKKAVVQRLIDTFGTYHLDGTPFMLYDEEYHSSDYGNGERWIRLARDQRHPEYGQPDNGYAYARPDYIKLHELEVQLALDIYVGTEYFEPPQTDEQFEKFMKGDHTDDTHHEWMPLTLDMILEWDKFMKYDNFDPEVLDTYMKDMERQLELNHSDDPEADKELDALTEEMDQLWAEMMKHATHEEIKKRVDLERDRRGLR